MKKPTKWRDFLRKSDEQEGNNKKHNPPQPSPPPHFKQQCPPSCPTQTCLPPQQQCPPPCPPSPSGPPPCPPPPNPCLGPCPPDRRCYPFDAFGLEKCTPALSDVTNPNQGIEIPVIINVTVPTGFVLPVGVSYTSHLSMDKSAVSTGLFTQYFVCTTTNDPVNPNTRMVKTQVARLSGTMYYNLTLNGFMPANPVDDSEAVPTTYLNQTGYFDVEYVLAYLAPTVQVVPTYSIEARLVNTKIEGNLQDPSIERTLHFTFALKIQVLPESVMPKPPETNEPGIQPLNN